MLNSGCAGVYNFPTVDITCFMIRGSGITDELLCEVVVVDS